MVSYAPRSARVGVFLSLRTGNVDSDWVVSRVRSLRRCLRGQAVILWDGLGAHRSAYTTRFLATQRSWLRVEPLPAYAPELNPVELMWANLSARELANLCPDTLSELAHQVRQGISRIRRHPNLSSAFLKHCGLFLDVFL